MGAFEGLADFIVDFKALKQKVADLAVAISPEAVRMVGAAGQPAFANSWVNFDADRPASFYRQGGRVYLSGLIKSGTIATTVFTLPAGYLPLSVNGLLFPIVSNGSFGFAAVYASGIVQANTGSNVYFSLDGISFRHA